MLYFLGKGLHVSPVEHAAFMHGIHPGDELAEEEARDVLREAPTLLDVLKEGAPRRVSHNDDKVRPCQHHLLARRHAALEECKLRSK